MKKVVIIEDEQLITDSLVFLLKEMDPSVEVTATLSSVEESIPYFTANGSPDLIFSDVQLSDGLAFSIFNTVKVSAPVIFITAYEQFMINAFEYNGIDYLLKPVDKTDLEKALTKYQKLQQHFTPSVSNVKQAYPDFYTKKKTRLVVKGEQECRVLRTADIVLFYTENKVCFAVDKEGRNYMVDKNLSELEEELDDRVFFRANRQYLLNVDYIKCYKVLDRVKLQVETSLSSGNHFIIISQETAPLFKKWIATV